MNESCRPPNRIELLSPAGSPERLDFALRYGADAVYCALPSFGLRRGENFTWDNLALAARNVHADGKRIYIALNAYMRNDDIAPLREAILRLAKIGVDAFILSDPAVLATARELAPRMALHISTQANTLNYAAADFWHKLGANRIILGRELSLDDIRVIRDNTPDTLELEAFVHGAMCVSYSGRCLLSNALCGRDANRGDCIQPCRWEYELRPVDADGEAFPVIEDEHGAYILNSCDLMMLEHIRALIDAGVSSFKIEGRMKTIFYTAAVTNAYRMAIDDAINGRAFDQRLSDEIRKVSHRPYSTGFYFGHPADEGVCSNAGGYTQAYDYVAVVLEDGVNDITVQQRNRFFEGDTLEILSPGDIGRTAIVNSIADAQTGERLASAPHPMQTLRLAMNCEVKKGDIFRKCKITLEN